MQLPFIFPCDFLLIASAKTVGEQWLKSLRVVAAGWVPNSAVFVSKFLG